MVCFCWILISIVEENRYSMCRQRGAGFVVLYLYSQYIHN